MSPVERAAAAMFKVDYPKDNWDRLGAGGFHQTRYCKMARAAIESMRESTEELVEGLQRALDALRIAKSFLAHGDALTSDIDGDIKAAEALLAQHGGAQ